MMTLTIELSKEDFYQFSYYTGWSAPWNRKKRLTYHLKNLIVPGAISFFIVYLMKTKLSTTALVAGGITLTLFNLFILPSWIRSNYKKLSEKFYDDPSNNNFFLPAELTIDERGIETKDKVSSVLHTWAAFIKKEETEDYHYLYLNAYLGLVIPKTSFKSAGEQEQFRKILLQYFPLKADLESLSGTV